MGGPPSHSADYIYGVAIEGVGNSDGQTWYCYPNVPDNLAAAPGYVDGLAEPPRGVSASWDLLTNRMSTGRYTITLLDGYGPVDWGITTPVPVTEFRCSISDADTVIDHALTNTQAGIAVDDVLYFCRETVLVTVAAGAATSFTCTRGHAGSTARAVDYEAGLGPDIYRVPPALIGRKCEVVQISRDQIDAGAGKWAPVTILVGNIWTEVVSGLGPWSFEIVDRFSQGRLNKEPARGLASPSARADDGSGYTGTTVGSYLPHGNASGGYWLFPNDSVRTRGWDAVGQYWYTDSNPQSIFYGEQWEPPETGTSQQTYWEYLILLSDVASPYPAFRYTVDGGANWLPSDNPAIIALNLLLSSETGTNYGVLDDNWYDLGPATTAGGLWPRFAMGVPRAQVDLAAFEDAALGILAGIHADRFWLGGRDEESIDSALIRLFSPLGYVCGCNRSGIWTLLHFADVYPGDTTVAIDHVYEGTSIEHQTLGRALDQVTLHCQPGPDGVGTETAIISEDDGRAYFPETVGQEEELDNVPYTIAQVESLAITRLIQDRFRRLCRRLPLLTFKLGAEYFDSVDLGTAVEIKDLAIRDPEFGGRLAAGVAIPALVVALNGIDYYSRTIRVTVALASRRHIGMISPSALVTAWKDDEWRLSVDPDIYSGSDDEETFVDGDYVVLCDEHLVRLSKCGDMTVDGDPAANRIFLSRHPRDDGDVEFDPTAGMILVYDDYDYATTHQLDYVFDSSGGLAGVAPTSGDDDDPPYRYGD